MLAAVVPAEGTVRVSTKRRGDAAVYTVKIKAANVSALLNPPSLMSFTVRVGAARLSQSLPLRRRGNALLYP